MKEAAVDRVETPQLLPVLYAPVQAGLHQVEEVFRDILRSKSPFVDDLVKYGFRLGGKRLRPALLLLSGLACGSFGADHILLAAAVEMIHTATLIHDDVLDEATMRRHLDTVNARWDNETSVILGDYLFALRPVPGEFGGRRVCQSRVAPCLPGDVRRRTAPD